MNVFVMTLDLSRAYYDFLIRENWLHGTLNLPTILLNVRGQQKY